MSRALPHLAGLVLPEALIAGAHLGGVWTFLPLALLLGVLPIVDAIAGLNVRNAGEDAEELSASVWFRAITWLRVPAQIAMPGWDVSHVAAGGPPFLDPRSCGRGTSIAGRIRRHVMAAMFPPIWRRLMDPRVAGRHSHQEVR
jgi:hypothetical protein